MRVYIQKNESELIVSFEGAGSFLRERFLRESRVCLKISRAILSARAKVLIVDFRDLQLIDAVCLRASLFTTIPTEACHVRRS